MNETSEGPTHHTVKNCALCGKSRCERNRTPRGCEALMRGEVLWKGRYYHRQDLYLRLASKELAKCQVEHTPTAWIFRDGGFEFKLWKGDE